MLELFPDSASIEGGELEVGGARASALAERFGTPLVVYCEDTLRARARASFGRPSPTRSSCTGRRPSRTSPFSGCSRRRGSERTSPRSASSRSHAPRGSTARRLVVHGNAKSDDELRAAADAGATVALDGEGDAERAAAAGVRRVLVRVTLGVEADTHEAIQTGHHGSKFGLPPEAALRAIENARGLGLDVAGLHIHVGSQLADLTAHEETIALLAAFAARCRDELSWTPELVNAGGGFAVRHTLAEPEVRLGDLARAVESASRASGSEHGLPAATRPRAGPRARRAGGSDAVSRPHREAARGRDLGRRRRRDVRQPAAAALRRPLHRALGGTGGRARARDRQRRRASTASRATS